MGLEVGDVAAEQVDPAPARHEAADGVQKRRLPGAVGADETDHLAGLGPEADTIDRHQSGKRHRQIDTAEH